MATDNKAYCPACKSLAVPGKRLCADCGIRLITSDSDLIATDAIDAHIQAVLDTSLKDRKFVEAEADRLILTRFSEWATVFGRLLLFPLLLLAASLSVWGISKFLDFNNALNSR